MTEQQSEPYSIDVVVSSENGLHARPAGKIAQEAQRFESDINIIFEDETVDAKSILDLLTLAAGQGAHLQISAQGADAEKALVALEALFLNNFNE